MKKYLVSILLTLCSFTVFAEKATLSGYVQDSKTREKLIGATVYIPTLKIGTRTNAYGFYSLTYTVPENDIQVKASYVGYALDSILLPKQSSTHNFDLVQQKDLKEIVVKA